MLAGASVLLVEDNEINQQVAMEILAGAGMKVALANNGQEALDLIRAERFDALLMDVQMPVMDGYTATREIRKWEGGMRKASSSPIPIIAMTAHAMSGDHEKSLAAGMSDHITKPIDPAQLFRTLAKWIHTGEKAPPSAELSPAPTGRQAQEPPLPEQILPEELPGFDLSDGLRRLMGNRRLYRKLLVDFAAQYDQAAARIRSALDAGNLAEAHGMVHAIKGVAGNLAAKDLQAQSVALEKLVKHADPACPPPAAEINRAYDTFRQSLSRALASLTCVLPPDAAPPPGDAAAAPLSPALAKEAAARLREAAELGDLSGLAAVCNDLSAKSEAFVPYAARVARLADDFDFDGVVKLAQELEK
jgi:CheY-like chemotaxis protein